MRGARAALGSRDRGSKGHRILRRVLVGGRHLGPSRAISFHEGVVTATLAASSRGKAIRTRKSPTLLKVERRLPEFRGEGEATEVSEARSQQAPWEKHAHAFVAMHPIGGSRREAKGSACLACDPLKRSRVS